MPRSPAVEAYYLAVRVAHKSVVDAVGGLITVLDGTDTKLKIEQCQRAISATNDLERVLPHIPIRPSWLGDLKRGLSRFLELLQAGHSPQGRSVRLMIALEPRITAEAWDGLQADDDPPLDLDAIYDAYEKESRIPELLDLLIQQLEKIRDSGQVDSISLRGRLEVLIQTLRKERSKGVAQRERLVRYSGWFLESLLFNLAKLTPIQPLVDAVRETLEKIREEQGRLAVVVEPKTKELFCPTMKSLPPGSVPEDQGEAGGLSESSHPESE